jgi:hypothetical protein
MTIKFGQSIKIGQIVIYGNYEDHARGSCGLGLFLREERPIIANLIRFIYRKTEIDKLVEWFGQMVFIRQYIIDSRTGKEKKLEQTIGCNTSDTWAEPEECNIRCF